ncbi:AI-2E family transporter [Campylobacter sp. RM12920]|uniref:AI-2E family transporter n=1 Tax=Campylobacter californiensis TaxID=1032243 RepID=A0ABD4JJD1_9BACT|nr:AI-2E family transporter [Campylobacter sp. RM12919]MBE2988006.1 AI-2E family transporter [Campylobacter sp. RM12920]
MNSRIFFGFLVFFALSLVLYLFKPFLLNIFIAMLLAVATSNINVKFLTITKNKRTLSASLTTIVLFLLFIAPLLYAVIKITKHAAGFDIDNITTTIDYIKNYDFKLPGALSFLEPNFKEFINEFDIKTLFTQLISNLTNLGKTSIKFIADIIVILVFFFFCNLYGSELVAYLKNALPLEKYDTQYVLSEVANVMSVVSYSTIANMIIQGFLFAIITMIYGYDGFLTGILFAFASLVPVIGGLLAWGPLSLYEFANGNVSAAIVIAVYTIVVISIIADTFLKPLVIKFINSRLVKIPTQINELLIFFAMIAGLTTFGFWGVILGPAIVTFFMSVIKLYTLLRERSFV